MRVLRKAFLAKICYLYIFLLKKSCLVCLLVTYKMKDDGKATYIIPISLQTINQEVLFLLQPNKRNCGDILSYFEGSEGKYIT